MENGNTVRRRTSSTPTPKEAAEGIDKLPGPRTNTQQLLLLSFFPATLIFGTLWCFLSPHSSDPNYFSKKSNLFNVYFVKYGWLWTTLVFGLHAARLKPSLQLQAIVRYGLATTFWIAITQWFFGPPIMDRGFTFTGGYCELVAADRENVGSRAEYIMASAACRSANGQWKGGHDLSGHVFLLCHASLFLASEIWPVVAKKVRYGGSFDITTKAVLSLVGLWWWMLLMTSIYFHTTLEKVSGIVVAYAEWYIVYVWAQRNEQLRAFLGAPEHSL
ncbi:hypothetical protein BJ508DRAFT_410993 [Ascobolus immersus RN42]|uniref:Acyl-coenzyme A diphosphatase SCS3 n=1 Tax=Ascobolus immersus RN42 TaxID=1160509 RepID=A0A3N4IKZ4_ASCIM|nr:hypothetical protein BJ508DRAFT_410993 [Ascobolus immersus RN42]